MMLLAVETQVSGWCVSLSFFSVWLEPQQPITSWLNWPMTATIRRIYTINWWSTIHMTLKMTSAQVVKTSVIVNNNSSFQNYTNPDDHTQQTTDTSGFKPFTVLCYSVLILNTGWRETKWGKVPCLRKQYDDRYQEFNHQPSNPKSKVLTVTPLCL